MNAYAAMAQAVERILGKDEVGGSSPPSSSNPLKLKVSGDFSYVFEIHQTASLNRNFLVRDAV